MKSGSLVYFHSLPQDMKNLHVTDADIKTKASEYIPKIIKFVENQPKGSWLHFHCKEGIGRTTTFMIMYDIIKNNKTVSLNDIITRQVLLSGMNPEDAQSFYNGEHNKFLNNFYNTYISKSTSSIKYINICINDYYMKNTLIP